MNVKPHLLLLGLTFFLAAVSAAVGSVLPPPISGMEVMWVTDMTDDRKLVGVCDNVFVGRVVGRALASQPDEIVPNTQFRVQVVQSIKGNLVGTVVVNQAGGWDGRVLELFAGDPLLIVGQTYLFASRQGPGRWQTPVSGYGDIPVHSEEEQAALIDRFTRAVQHQIPWPDSVLNP